MTRYYSYVAYSRFRLQQGFSIIELITAMAVLAIILSAAFPGFRNMIANSQIRTTAESIVSGISMARAEAVKRNAQVKFTLNNDTSWQVGCVTVVAIACPAVIQLKAARDGASGTTSIALTGANNITFTSLGTVTTAPGQLESVVVDSTNISAVDSRELRVVMSGSGVKMCDPNVSATTDPRHCI